MRLPRFSRERATRLFDGCQAALVWLAVLAFVVPEPDVEALALAAMAAIGLAAAFVALCPAPEGARSGDLAVPPEPATGKRSGNPKEDEPHVL